MNIKITDLKDTILLAVPKPYEMVLGGISLVSLLLAIYVGSRLAGAKQRVHDDEQRGNAHLIDRSTRTLRGAGGD